ncbi:MAG: amidohydrolase [Gammaproteobacteria bacterium]|nr:amidohydrolase [Gammaproteobacteria bacterium]
MKRWLLLTSLCLVAVTAARAEVTGGEIDAAGAALEPRVIDWRRDFHRHPELGNREFRTSGIVAEHLRSLGLEVKTGIAHTGVVAVLRGTLPGPTIMLRADMDALPVTELTDVPFRSTATAEFRGRQVGVMHACGHDAHTAILMGVAEILAGLRERLPGTVMFVFQPAEEGVPEGEQGGAPLMMQEGLFDITKPAAIFGLHVISTLHSGAVGVRSGPFMAGSDFFRIVVIGRQSHGARPWAGIDPIVTAAQIINSLQTIVSRQTDITAFPAVLTIGAINGGVRHNIIAETVEMLGTLRTFTPAIRQEIIDRMQRVVIHVAEANGATATLEMMPAPNPVVDNDPALTRKVAASLEAAFGGDAVKALDTQTVAEDFSYYSREAPSVYYWVGITPPGQNLRTAPDNHSDKFFVDESGIAVGLKSLLHVAVDYLQDADHSNGP